MIILKTNAQKSSHRSKAKTAQAKSNKYRSNDHSKKIESSERSFIDGQFNTSHFEETSNSIQLNDSIIPYGSKEEAVQNKRKKSVRCNKNQNGIELNLLACLS